MAENFGAGRGFVFDREIAGRVPGYPFLLWIVGAVAGDPVVGGKVLQAFLGAAGAILAWRIGRREFGEAAGRIAGLLTAVDPFLIYFSTQVLVEASLSTVLLLLMDLLLRAAEDHRPRRAALAGLATGVACLFHPNQLAFLGFLLPFWLARAGRARLLPAIRSYALVVCFALLVILPWSVRNYVRLGGVVPLTSRLGDGLYEAFCPEAYGGPVKDKIVWPAGLEGLGELERDRFLRRAAWGHIARDPARAVRLGARKLFRFWNLVPNYEGYKKPVYEVVSIGFCGPVFLLALAGLLGCGRDLRAKALLASPTLYNMSLHTVFVSSLRFRIPVMPFLALLAGYATARAVEGWRSRAGPAAPS
jgi:4-amino-4-deoxy-L-arabinose transferase-like glycosyltransferase